MKYRTPTSPIRPVPRHRRAARGISGAAGGAARVADYAPAYTFLVRLLAAVVGALLTLVAASRLVAQSNSAEVPRASAAAHAAAPDPTLSADDVVAIVLDALSQNDRPTKDRGIEVTFGFASPSNRALMGPIDRFGDLVREETYRPLLYHHHAVRSPAKVFGERATQRVVITTATGERVAYTFSLSRQTDGPFKGCWMTDGVTREPPSALRHPNFAMRGIRGERAG